MSARPALAASDSGVYQSPADVADLRARATEIGATWTPVDLGSVRDKASLLRRFADALAFPADFGRNWDALNDSLQDLSWLRANGHVLHLCNIGGVRQALDGEWDTLLDILHEAANFWKSRKPFVVIVDGIRDFPPWL
jgi:RNAse (barnase) inhibitor barstar